MLLDASTSASASTETIGDSPRRLSVILLGALFVLETLEPIRADNSPCERLRRDGTLICTELCAGNSFPCCLLMLGMVFGDKGTWNLVSDARQSDLPVFRGLPMVVVLQLGFVDRMVVGRKAGVASPVSENIPRYL